MASNWPNWPPNLDALKADAGTPASAGTRDDVALGMELDAAIAFVQEYHDGRYNFGLGESGEDDLPDPPATIVLGTLRLAWRWFRRRKSVDGQTGAADTTSPFPSLDTDIERLLRMGKQSRGVVAP